MIFPLVPYNIGSLPCILPKRSTSSFKHPFPWSSTILSHLQVFSYISFSLNVITLAVSIHPTQSLQLFLTRFLPNLLHGGGFTWGQQWPCFQSECLSARILFDLNSVVYFHLPETFFLPDYCASLVTCSLCKPFLLPLTMKCWGSLRLKARPSLLTILKELVNFFEEARQ